MFKWCEPSAWACFSVENSSWSPDLYNSWFANCLETFPDLKCATQVQKRVDLILKNFHYLWWRRHKKPWFYGTNFWEPHFRLLRISQDSIFMHCDLFFSFPKGADWVLWWLVLWKSYAYWSLVHEVRLKVLVDENKAIVFVKLLIKLQFCDTSMQIKVHCSEL